MTQVLLEYIQVTKYKENIARILLKVLIEI